MTDALPEVPDLDSSKVAGASFGRSRKGFEPTEVRTLLGRVADALRVWEQRDARLASRVEELSRRLDEAEEFDEDRVTEVLGAETARIVTAARSAASEMRAEAERESTELLERSRAEAEETAGRLVGEASRDREAAAGARTEAEEAAAGIISEATATAEQRVAEATSAAETMRTDATDEAEALRSSSREEAQELRDDAQRRHDEMIEKASGILADRTAEAEEAAAAMRDSAEADAAGARAAAASELDSARKEAERLVSEARAEATAEIEAARERGREMLAETREVRRRMLSDLAEKNRLGRQKVEGAKAARAGVVEAIRSTLGTLEQALTELDGDDRELKRLAEAAAAAVADDVDTVARELEEQLDTSSQESEPESGEAPAADGDAAGSAAEDASVSEATGDAATDAGDDASGVEPTNPDPELESGDASAAGDLESDAPGDQVVVDVTDTAVSDSATEAQEETAAAEAQDEPAEDEADGDDVRVDAEPVAGDDAGDDASQDTDGEPGDATGDTDSEQMASVHDLFEKLRSNDDEPGGDQVGESDPSPTGEPAPVLQATEGAVAVAVRPDTEATPGSVPDEPVAEQEGEDEPQEAVLGTATGDQGLLDRRDELLAPAERLLARNLKRLVGDEQNEVLDRARRHKRGRVELEDLLDEDAPKTFTDGLADPYVLAAVAGAQMWAEISGGALQEPGRGEVADSLGVQVGEMLEMRRIKVREALEAHDRSGSDTADLVDLMRSVYRELRATAVPELAADLASGGFNSGTAAAAGSDAVWRWVPDNGGLPCADAEDNSLEGPIACGKSFPTGDVVPPAHPGCRCIVVPVASD